MSDELSGIGQYANCYPSDVGLAMDTMRVVLGGFVAGAPEVVAGRRAFKLRDDIAQVHVLIAKGISVPDLGTVVVVSGSVDHPRGVVADGLWTLSELDDMGADQFAAALRTAAQKAARRRRTLTTPTSARRLILRPQRGDNDLPSGELDDK